MQPQVTKCREPAAVFFMPEYLFCCTSNKRLKSRLQQTASPSKPYRYPDCRFQQYLLRLHNQTGDIFQKFCLIGDIGNNVQEIHHCGNAKSDAESAAAQECGDSKTDAGKLNLDQKIGKMQQADFFPEYFFTDQ